MQVYLNGSFVPEDEARISPMDRGFLFGDAVYEAVRYFDRHGVGLMGHIARLARSLELTGISGFEPGQIEAIGADLLQRNEITDGAVYFQVSRGAEPLRSHFPDQSIPPTVFAFAWALPSLEECSQLREVAAVIAPDERWRRCDIKATSLIASVLAKLEADRQDAFEAILQRDGWITEGASTNVLLVRHGKVSTPPVEGGLFNILHGITRDMVLNLCEGMDERPIRVRELLQADEIILTSSTTLMSAVTQLDGHRVGSGHSGPIGRSLYAQLLNAIKARVQGGDAGGIAS